MHRDYGGFGSKGRTNEIKDPPGPKGLKHLPSGLVQKKCADPWSRGRNKGLDEQQQ